MGASRYVQQNDLALLGQKMFHFIGKIVKADSWTIQQLNSDDEKASLWDGYPV